MIASAATYKVSLVATQALKPLIVVGLMSG
jgi:hypothetical protein